MSASVDSSEPPRRSRVGRRSKGDRQVITARVRKADGLKLLAHKDETGESVSDAVARIVQRAVEAGEFDHGPSDQQRLDMEVNAS